MAYPLPVPVLPMEFLRVCSCMWSCSLRIAACGSMMMFCFVSPSSFISFFRTSMFMTHPAEMNDMLFFVAPAGSCLRTISFPLWFTVCPELGPPHLTVMAFCCFAMNWVTFPFPSEPYWPPTTMVIICSIPYS